MVALYSYSISNANYSYFENDIYFEIAQNGQLVTSKTWIYAPRKRLLTVTAYDFRKSMSL